jgi:hypothetical protein
MRNRQKDLRTSKEGPHTLPGRKVIRICFLEQQKLTIRDLTALYPTPGTLYMQIRSPTANTKHFTLSSCNTSLKNLTTVRRLRSVSRTRSCKQRSLKCNSLSLSLSLSLSQWAHTVAKSLLETNNTIQESRILQEQAQAPAFILLLSRSCSRVVCIARWQQGIYSDDTENLSSVSLPRSLITLNLSLFLFFSLH